MTQMTEDEWQNKQTAQEITELVAHRQKENWIAATAAVECGHRLWDLLELGIDMAAAAGDSRMGAEHLLLHMLRDPNTIPTRELAEMGLDSQAVFMRLAEAARCGSAQRL